MSQTNLNKKTSREIQILLKKIVKPSSPTPKHLQNYKLSSFDQLAPRAHLPFVFFYPVNDTVEAAKSGKRCQHLEKTLSEILSHFYPLAGRLNDDGFSVDCQDQGVLYVKTKTDCHLTEFLNEAYENIELLTHFVPWDMGEANLVTMPMVGVQVTMFECGGVAITVYISHALADGYTMFNFTNEWAKMSRSKFNDAKCLNFNVASIFPGKDISGRLKPFPGKKPVAKIVTRRFLFDGVAISRLKERVKANAPGIKSQFSKVVVVTALLWRGLMGAARARHGNLRPSLIFFSINLQGKTCLLPSEDFFGNLYIAVPIRFMPKDSTVELHDIACLIADKLQKTFGDFAKSSSDDLFTMAIDFQNEIREAVGNDEMEVHICSSLCRFPLYEADFGWGTPSWVSDLKLPFEMFTLMDTKCGTGIEARVNLNEIDMLVLQSDSDIVEFTSTSK